MKRTLVLALSGLLATALASCSKREAPAGAPPGYAHIASPIDGVVGTTLLKAAISSAGDGHDGVRAC